MSRKNEGNLSELRKGAINCDTFWLQSFGTRNSFLEIKRIMCYYIMIIFALFFIIIIIIWGQFQRISALEGLYLEGRSRRVFCVTSLGGFGGAYTWRGLLLRNSYNPARWFKQIKRTVSFDVTTPFNPIQQSTAKYNSHIFNGRNTTINDQCNSTDDQLTHSKYTEVFSTILAYGSIFTLITCTVKVPIAMYLN